MAEDIIDLGSLTPSNYVDNVDALFGKNSYGVMAAVKSAKFVATRQCPNDFNLMTKQGVYEVSGIMANSYQGASPTACYGRAIVLGSGSYFTQIFFTSLLSSAIIYYRPCGNNKFGNWFKLNAFTEIKPPESTGGG